jgi:Fic family protein
MMNRLLDGLDGKLNISEWTKVTEVSTDTALRDILNLEEQAVLVEQSGGGTSTS